jgi:diguanylate cyclase (GGDEF)-like protein
MPHSELKRTLQQLVWPNGTIVLIAAIVIASGFLNGAIRVAANYAAVAVIAAGLLTAWRFHAMRSIAGLLLFAISTVSFAHAVYGHALYNAICFLLPLNLVAVLMVEEFTLSWQPIGYWAVFISLQAGLIAATCRPGDESSFWLWLNPARSPVPTLIVPPLALMMFVLAAGALLFKFAKDLRPLDAGLAWALLPSVMACHSRGPLRTAYLAVGAVAITISVIETSYQLAYEDELTRLPGRRAFNQTIAALADQYSIAMVDVDHFKSFNDTYGHDIGDQVLRMVASRLAAVTGDGRSFRCGGEEFAVVFPGKTSEEAMEHAEDLRRAIEATSFMVRGPERSRRRRDERRYRHSARHLQSQDFGTSVTVSIGIAQPRAGNDDVQWVIEAADKALYAAKERGRNRVVVATVGKKRKAAAALSR